MTSKNLLLIATIALVLGCAFSTLIFDEGAGLNIPIFAALVLIGVWILNLKLEKRFSSPMRLLAVLIIFFSTMVFVRESPLLTFFNILGCLLLLLILASTYAGKSLKDYLPWDYLKVFLLPVHFVAPLFEAIGAIVGLRKTGTRHDKTREIIRGILMAILAVTIFTTLFASADEVFGKFVSNIFSFSFRIDEELLGHLVIFAIVSAAFLGAFGYMYRKIHPAVAPEGAEKPRNLGVIESTILLSSINALFLGFIALQLTYLFGGQSHLAAQGLTYAEYARKGFYELVLVAILSYIIISIAEKQIIKREDGHFSRFKFLSAFLVVEVVAILGSAFYRLSLYESAYGFSNIRLYSHALMIWLGIILILLAHHILTHGSRAAFAQRSFVCVVLLLLAMNVLNPDAFIAKKNLERYYMGGDLDVGYLASLSDDAIPYSVGLLNDFSGESMTEHDAFTSKLYWARKRRSVSGWKALHISNITAEKALAPHKDYMEKYKGIEPPIVEVDF